MEATRQVPQVEVTRRDPGAAMSPEDLQAEDTGQPEDLQAEDTGQSEWSPEGLQAEDTDQPQWCPEDLLQGRHEWSAEVLPPGDPAAPLTPRRRQRL